MSADRIADEAAAYRLFEQLRWGGAPDACPHCGATGRFYFLRPADGETRATRTGAPSPRRVWRCATCRRQFSVLTGTVFQATKVPLTTWLTLLSQLTRSPDGADLPSASVIAERCEVDVATARHLRERVLSAAGCEPVRALIASRPVG